MRQGKELGLRVEIDVDEEIAKKLANVRLWCIQWSPSDRPSMKRVVQMLEDKYKRNFSPLYYLHHLTRVDDHLRENVEATMDVPSDHIPYLKKAFDGLETGLAGFLQASAPDWIIYDFAPH
ncbi:hypothetical protein ACSBR2_006059 [Camellia fascicularis]